MTQHDTAQKLANMIMLNPSYDNILNLLKLSYGSGFDRGRSSRSFSIPVLQLTMHGGIVAHHDSMGEAADSLNMATSSIWRAVNGKWRHAGGYKWRALNE